MSSRDKDLSKELRFAIPPKQIDYSNVMTEFELYTEVPDVFRGYRKVVITDKEKHIEGVKRVISDSNKFVN